MLWPHFGEGVAVDAPENIRICDFCDHLLGPPSTWKTKAGGFAEDVKTIGSLLIAFGDLAKLAGGREFSVVGLLEEEN